jgi:hypothetical protein
MRKLIENLLITLFCVVALPISAQQAIPPITKSVFVLKGFHLNMTKEEVKKLIPAAKFELVEKLDGKDWYGYQCGVIVQQSPAACNFTYAGEPITAISVKFWGERAYEVQFYYGAFRPQDHGVAAVHLDRQMRASLDLKYPKESNGAGPGSVWTSGSEYMTTEIVTDRNFKSDSISLVDTKYKDLLDASIDRYVAEKEARKKQQTTKKVTSDM